MPALSAPGTPPEAASATLNMNDLIKDYDARIEVLPARDVSGAEAIKLELVASPLPREYLPSLLKKLAEKAGADKTIMVKEVLSARAALGQSCIPGTAQNGGAPPSTMHNPPPSQAPWPLELVLEKISKAIARQVECSPQAVAALALWVAGTYGYEEAPMFPRVAITSPTKRCGKSTLLGTLRAVVSRPIKADNVSASAIFRTIQNRKPTLLIDEVDSFLKTDDSLRGVLNAGYERSGAVLRSVPTPDGKNFMEAEFPVYCPVALAGIGGLPDTVLDRSIIIRLQRAAARAAGGARKKPLRHRELEQLRDMIAPHLVAHAAALCAAMSVGATTGLPQISDRAADNWEPLLAIADLASGRWPNHARAAAIALSDTTDAPSHRELLLADLQNIVDTERRLAVRAFQAWRGKSTGTRPFVVRRLRSADIVVELNKMEDRPWPEYGRDGKGITTARLAALLKPFGITPSTQRVPARAQSKPSNVVSDTVRTYPVAKLRAAFRQYLS